MAKLNQRGNNIQVVSTDMIMIGILIGIMTVTQIGTFMMMGAVAMITSQSSIMDVDTTVNKRISGVTKALPP